MIYAAEIGHIEIVKLLLEQEKIDVNAKTEIKKLHFISKILFYSVQIIDHLWNLIWHI